MYLEFNGRCLKQDKITYDHGKIVNIYIVYGIRSILNYNDDFTLKNFLFCAVRLTKNADVNKYKYSEYGIGFNEKVFFHIQLVVLVKMKQSSEQIRVHLLILIIKKQTFQFLEKIQLKY